MATRNSSKFDSFSLTPEEQRSGAMLTHLNKMFIQNLLNDSLLRRLNLEVDTTNVLAFAQQEAAIKAEILTYTHLLDCSEAAEKELYQLQSGNILNSGE